MPEGVGAHLGEALNDFSGKPRDAIELKVFRDTPTLIFPGPLDFTFLTSEIPGIFGRRLQAGHVEGSLTRVDFDAWDLTVGEKVLEARARLTKQLCRRHAIAGR
jgi:hypothetical protein